MRSVEVHEISSREPNTITDLLKVHVFGDMQLHVKSNEFQERIKVSFDSFSYKIEKPIELTVQFRIKVIDNIDPTNNSESDWLVASQVGSQSSDVHCVAERLKALPWVGIALEITSDHIGGRVFCVLPMPNEVSCHLPVHVNATFSLNDERRELKWSGFERKNDLSATWNTLIIRDLLPLCYASLLVNYATQLLTGEDFYRAWPDISKVRYTNWKDILIPFFRLILSCKVFYSQSNQWVSKDQACFIPEMLQVPNVVMTLLSTCGENVVKIPHEVWEAFTFMDITVQTVTPKYARLKLKPNKHIYKHFTNNQKLELLCYCLSDAAYEDLEGLALLPLKDGSFKDFISRRNVYNTGSVYMCSSQYPSYLIPSYGNQLVDMSSDQELHEKLIGVAKSNCTQLTMLNVNGVKTLLSKCLSQYTIVRLPHNVISLDWVKLFWEWVPKEQLWLFSELLVVPVYNTCDGATYVVRLSKNSPAVFSTTPIDYLHSALGKLHVNICELTRFPFIHMSIVSLMNQCSADGVLDAVHSARQYRNVTFTTEEATALRYILHDYTTGSQRQSILRELSIFNALSNTSRQLYSIRQASSGVTEPSNFTLNADNLPTELVLFSNSEYYQLVLLQKLSVQQPTTIDLLVDLVFPLIRRNCGQVVPLMKELLEKISEITCIADPRQRLKLKSGITNLSFLPVGPQIVYA